MNELKLSLVIDDYKLNNKAEIWEQCFKSEKFKKMYPNFDNYEFVREVIGPPLTENTITLFRFYRPKSL